MQAAFSWLDIVLALVLIWQLIYGWQAGFLVSLCSVVGFAIGSVAAFFAMPLVSTWVGDSGWRVAAIVGSAVLLVLVGYYAGSALGRSLSKGVHAKPLKMINRILGSITSVVVTALLISPIAFSISALGIPVISQAIDQSAIVRGIDAYTPRPVQQVMAQLRSTVVDERIPQLFNQLGPKTDIAPPAAAADTPALNRAAQSMVRITGVAYQCGQNQTGSGFVVAPGKVLTNAHVVAGVNQPVVETSSGVLRGQVVYFDPTADLAIISAPGLTEAPLQQGADLQVGQQGVFDGYPHGGPFQSKPATVAYKGFTVLADIYNSTKHTSEVYQLAADVQPGNSGGPLLNDQGQVVGVVFAKSQDTPKVGYAFTMAEVSPVIAQAGNLSAQVSSGACVRE